MKYWVFSVKRMGAGDMPGPMDVYTTRMGDRAWGFHKGEAGRDPNNMRYLREGHKVVFYIAGPDAGLAGIAELDSESIPWAQLNEYERSWLPHPERPGFRPDYVVRLCHVKRWESLKSGDLLPWPRGVPQGSIHEIEEEVYQRICD
jgi:hypothetical protein